MGLSHIPISLWPIIIADYMYCYSWLGLSYITYSSLASLCMSKGVDRHHWVLLTLHFPPVRVLEDVYKHWWACHTWPIPLWPILVIMPEYLYWYSQLGLSNMTYTSLPACAYPKVYIDMYIKIVGPVTHNLFLLCQIVCVQRFILTSFGLSHMAFSPLPVRVPEDVY